MKSNVSINPSLFKSEPQGTNSITSSLTIYHQMRQPGTYHGMIVKSRSIVGTFTVTCTDASAETQADIDLYQIDISLPGNANKKPNDYAVRPGGYVVFFSSFGEGGYDVRLRSEGTDYHTTKLEQGDLVLALLLQAGDYEMSGPGQQKCIVVVEEIKETREHMQALRQAVTVTLNDQEFTPREVRMLQGQGLVVAFETQGGLAVRLVTPRDVPEEGDKRHNWENPKYKYMR